MFWKSSNASAATWPSFTAANSSPRARSKNFAPASKRKAPRPCSLPASPPAICLLPEKNSLSNRFFCASSVAPAASIRNSRGSARFQFRHPRAICRHRPRPLAALCKFAAHRPRASGTGRPRVHVFGLRHVGIGRQRRPRCRRLVFRLSPPSRFSGLVVLARLPFLAIFPSPRQCVFRKYRLFQSIALSADFSLLLSGPPRLRFAGARNRHRHPLVAWHRYGHHRGCAASFFGGGTRSAGLRCLEHPFSPHGFCLGRKMAGPAPHSRTSRSHFFSLYH